MLLIHTLHRRVSLLGEKVEACDNVKVETTAIVYRSLWEVSVPVDKCQPLQGKWVLISRKDKHILGQTYKHGAF